MDQCTLHCCLSFFLGGGGGGCPSFDSINLGKTHSPTLGHTFRAFSLPQLMAYHCSDHQQMHVGWEPAHSPRVSVKTWHSHDQVSIQVTCLHINVRHKKETSGVNAKKCQGWKKREKEISRALESESLRAYSFCAVFLFRFINRNRYRRVQKERLSFERNNFHGNKMAHCLISNWKGKKYENIIWKRNSKKNTGTFLDRLLVFANPVIFFILSRQSSNVYSWLPARNGELLLCWQPSFPRGKAVRKMRNKTRNSLLCFPT